MPRFPVLTATRVERMVVGIGFKYVRSRGGHRIYVKGKHAVTIPFHAGDLKRKTLKSIIAQSGLTLEQFRKLL